MGCNNDAKETEFHNFIFCEMRNCKKKYTVDGNGRRLR